ncbi:MAG: methionyl-tRNA formyltransferase [Eubacteriales bacterium]|nr:methionyl-tRNA formyltransferase [Eubacteriales bacterium]MDD4139381.1 methionyl-tRNA formyltransferase [Eubacteriales bacterium]MDD4744018.1 methionyl-tRNA formyltransferase [Eubacteriales bacterium]
MKPRLVYMGTPDFAVPPLEALLARGDNVVAVVCQPDRPQGRHMALAAPPVKQRAVKAGIPVLQPEKLRDGTFEMALRAFSPDLVVTAAYGRILPPAILAVPAHGCLNIHASLLPAYRGAAPIQWSIVRGEKKTGVTIMLMDEGMDTGPILAQEAVPIPPDMNAGELSDQLSALGARMITEVIDSYLAGHITPRPQDPALAFAIPMLTREHGQIDWTRPARDVHNQIRGLYPWPGAYTVCQGKRLKIHRSALNEDADAVAAASGLAPGTICLCSPRAISVACGSGVLDILEIQTESGKRMHCRDCAHNYRFGQTMGGQTR